MLTRCTTICTALCLALAACSASPTPTPTPDAAPAADVAADAGQLDVAPLDAPPLDAEELEVGRLDAAGEAAAPADAPPDAGPEVAPVDAEELEVGPRDAAPEAPPVDAAPACTAGEARCPAGAEGPAFELCVAGVWTPGTCPAPGVTGTAPVCMGGRCFTCARADGGAGCSGEPLCAADVDCIRLGHARCVAGRCARRGAVRCTDNSVCAVWETASTRAPCADNALLGAMTCGTSVPRCTHDAMCPAGWRCGADGFCVMGA